MTPLVKRLLILAVVVALGAAGAAFRAGIILTVTNALGVTGRSAPKVAAVKPAPGQKPAPTAATGAANQTAANQPAAANPAAKSGAKAGAQPSTPAPIQASAGLGMSGPAKPGAPAKAQTAAKTPAPATNTAAQTPVAAGLTPPSVKSGATATAATPAKSGQRAGGPAAEPFIDPTERLSSWVREPYLYTSLGRRDPFGSLLNGEFVGDGEPGLVDVGNLKLVGIAWDQADRFAMVEDPRGFGYALREGDPVRSGKVLRINRTSVTFLQTMGGESNTITIELPTQAQEGK